MTATTQTNDNSQMVAMGRLPQAILVGAYTTLPFTRFWQIALIVLVLSFWGPTEANTDSSATITGLNMMHAMTGIAIIAALSALARDESTVA